MKPSIATLVLSTATSGLMLGVAQNARAALIPNVTVTTNLGADTGWNLNATVNGLGLPGNVPSLTGNHILTSGAVAWRSALLANQQGTTIPGGTITFNLNGNYNLSGFSFWNLGGNSADLTRQGIRNLTIEFSSDGGTTYNTLPGAPTSFTQGTFGSVASPTEQTPQPFSFAPVNATNVRFTNLSNFGSFDLSTNNRIGFAEIQFSGTQTQIPEPSSLLALLAFGLGGVSLRKRI